MPQPQCGPQKVISSLNSTFTSSRKIKRQNYVKERETSLSLLSVTACHGVSFWRDVVFYLGKRILIRAVLIVHAGRMLPLPPGHGLVMCLHFPEISWTVLNEVVWTLQPLHLFFNNWRSTNQSASKQWTIKYFLGAMSRKSRALKTKFRLFFQ